jgi:hypothetical protein
MGLAKFGKGKKKKVAKKSTSKYSGVTPAEDRDPILEDGLHQVKVLEPRSSKVKRRVEPFSRPPWRSSNPAPTIRARSGASCSA